MVVTGIFVLWLLMRATLIGRLKSADMLCVMCIVLTG